MWLIVTFDRKARGIWKKGKTAQLIRMFACVLIFLLVVASPEWIYDMCFTPEKNLCETSGVLENVYLSNTNAGNYASVGIEFLFDGERFYLDSNVISNKKPEVLSFISEIEKCIGKEVSITYMKRVSFIDLRSYVVEMSCAGETFFQKADALGSYAERSQMVFERCIILFVIILISLLFELGIIQIQDKTRSSLK